jgi:hypothetical protein
LDVEIRRVAGRRDRIDQRDLFRDRQRHTQETSANFFSRRGRQRREDRL